LVPEIACDASFEGDLLRAACDVAVSQLLTVEPDWLLLLAAGPRPARFHSGDHGSLAGYGVAVRVGLGSGAAPSGGTPPRLPLPFTIGAWLLARAGGHPVTRGVQVGPDGGLPGPEVLAVGRGALLVMGDGSARRGPHPPGRPDPRAEPHDRVVAGALAAGQTAVLAALEPDLGAELLAAGVPAWRAAGRLLAGRRFDAELLYHEAPYGVGYLVARWVAADA
jgi:hypothetical protein